MNCKPGDLAVIVRSMGGNLGKIVRCVRLSGWPGLTEPNGSLRPGPVWETDSMLTSWNGVRHCFVLDERLRPLRDNPGTDETLTWAPEKVSA